MIKNNIKIIKLFFLKKEYKENKMKYFIVFLTN